jgi:rod shape-determining protein MreB
VKFIEKFFRNGLAIDLGTVNTLIYQPGKGILLNEPSVVALDRYDGEVVCVGHKALKLLGREPRGIEVHRPIRSGTIYNFEVTRKMLRTFIGNVTDGFRFGHFVVGIPGSATAVAMPRTTLVDVASISSMKDSQRESARVSRWMTNERISSSTSAAAQRTSRLLRQAVLFRR